MNNGHLEKPQFLKGLLLLLPLLASCSTSPPPVPPATPHPSLHSAQKSTSDFILKEANRLALKVKKGELTRTQAADQLNLYRLKIVGPNRVDNSTFATYHYLAQERDAGTLSQEESHARMEIKLRDWQEKWPTLTHPPTDPAFTNFLMQLYDLKPLTAEDRSQRTEAR